MRIGRTLLLVTMTCLALPGFAQNPADLTFVLAPANGRTTFRMGEAIDVEFRISSTAPGKYVLEDNYRAKFIADPSDGIVNPQVQGASVPAGVLIGSTGRSGPGLRLITLNTNPTVRQRQLNAFFSFRKPGHYRIIAETDTVALSDGQSGGEMRGRINVRSNAIEIDIIKPETGWAESQLQANLALLAQWTPTPPPQAGQRSINNPQGELAAIAGVRALGLLETREAALALVEMYGKGVPVSISQYIDQGLRRSPYSGEIIAAMEKQIDAPDVPITRQWFGVFSDLEMMAISSPPDRAKVYTQCREKVIAGIEKKRGEAREISFRTVAQLK